MSILIKLDKFEGSLDLLCHLVAKNKMDIFDVDIITITDIYIYYLENSNYNDLDTASDFITMASKLLYIKSVHLLPKSEESEKLKEEFVTMLIDYTLCKKISELLKSKSDGILRYTLPEKNYNFTTKYEGKEDLIKLIKSYKLILNRIDNDEVVTESKFYNYVKTNYVSVENKIVYLLKLINLNSKLYLSQIFCGTKSENVATFLALLELIKEEKLDFDNIIKG